MEPSISGFVRCQASLTGSLICCKRRINATVWEECLSGKYKFSVPMQMQEQLADSRAPLQQQCSGTFLLCLLPKQVQTSSLKPYRSSMQMQLCNWLTSSVSTCTATALPMFAPRQKGRLIVTIQLNAQNMKALPAGCSSGSSASSSSSGNGQSFTSTGRGGAMSMSSSSGGPLCICNCFDISRMTDSSGQ